MSDMLKANCFLIWGSYFLCFRPFKKWYWLHRNWAVNPENNFLFRKLIRKLSERKIRLSPAIKKTNINFLFLFFHQNTEKAPRNYPNMQQREENVPPWKMDWNCFPSQKILNSRTFIKTFNSTEPRLQRSLRPVL